MQQLNDSPAYFLRLPLSTSARRFRLIFSAFFCWRSPMALVVLWAVLKIPVMRAGDTPPRWDRRRRRRVRRWRRGILTLTRTSPGVSYIVLGVDKREDVR